MEDIVKGPPCLAVIVEQWQNPHPETLIGAANESKDPAITVGSFLVCKFCGVIEPISSGQPVLEPPTVELEEEAPPESQEEAEDMGHADEEPGMMQTSQIVSLGSGLGFVGAGNILGVTASAALAQTGETGYNHTLDDFYNKYNQEGSKPPFDPDTDAFALELHQRGAISLSPEVVVLLESRLAQYQRNAISLPQETDSHLEEMFKTPQYITAEQLKQLGWNDVTNEMVIGLNNTLTKYDITTPERMRHFISQAMQESGLGLYTKELADGTAYEGREDLGNTQPGDGSRYKGAGYIQMTGRYNYQRFADFMDDQDIMQGVDYVSENYPWEASGFWWHDNDMNAIADDLENVSIEQKTLEISRAVNRGNRYSTGMPLHYENRKDYYNPF